MASSGNTPRSQAYSDRATECRAIAENLHKSETRRQLLEVAQEYERMAKEAAASELREADLDAMKSETSPRNYP